MQTKVWVRSKDGKIAGVCQMFAKILGVEVWVVRLIWFVAVLCYGTGLIFYGLLVLMLPREDKVSPDKKAILGVCLNISRRTGIELALVRLAAVVLLLASGGTVLLLYFLLYFILPDNASPTVV